MLDYEIYRKQYKAMTPAVCSGWLAAADGRMRLE
jgi:hypothetical protein